jgi:hypothetical protein
VTDSDLFQSLVREYATRYHLSNINIYSHTDDSIHNSALHPEVILCGVYAHYDHDGTLINIGESNNVSRRTREHQRTARTKGCRPIQSFHLVIVEHPWERFSLEKYLHDKVPSFQGRWWDWVKREGLLSSSEASSSK